MMKPIHNTVAALLLAVAPVFAIPPEDFGFPSAPNHTELSLSFMANGVRRDVSEGSLFGFGIAAELPTLALNTSMYESVYNYVGPYLACLVDPDARTPENPSSRFILHYLAADYRLSNTTSSTTTGSGGTSPRVLNPNGEPFVPYARPMPPTTSSPHRYIFYVFEQPSNFSIPPAYSGYSSENRTMFNLTNFIADASLGAPAAANYFFVSHQDAVPDDFVGDPGTEFPGGNGGAVTAGPGPSATPMSSSMGGSMSTGFMTSSMSGSMSGGSMTSSMAGSMASETASGGAAMASTTMAAGAPVDGARAGAVGMVAAVGAAVLFGV